MDTSVAFADLLAKVDREIDRFNLKRRNNRKRYSMLAIAQIVAGVASSLILGLSIPENLVSTAKNIALVLTSATTVCTLVLANFQFKDNFVSYTWVVSQLKQLRSELDFRQKALLPVGLPIGELEEYHKQFASILAESNQNWKSRIMRPGHAKDRGAT